MATVNYKVQLQSSATGAVREVPFSGTQMALHFADTEPSAGTRTYTIRINADIAGGQIGLRRITAIVLKR